MSAELPNRLDVSVVIPVYNNAGTLDELVDRLIRVLESSGNTFEVIFVDDGSDDDSQSIIEAHVQRDSRIRLLALTRNFGGQAALCAGFDAVRGLRTVCLDADLENAPEDIPILLAALDRGADLACGVRPFDDRPLARRILSRVLNAYVRRYMHTPVTDVGCGMRATNSSSVAGLASAGEKRRLLTPLIVERSRRVVEVPLRYTKRRGESRHSLLSLSSIGLDYFLISARYPFIIAGMVSVLGAVAGFLLVLVAIITTDMDTALGGLVLGCAGALGCVLSLLGVYLQRVYQLAQQIPFYEVRRPIPRPLQESSGDERRRSEACKVES